MSLNSFYERHGLWMVVTTCALFPLVGLAAILALASNTNDTRDWFPANFVETADYQWFEKHFGHDEFVLISWEGCTLNDPRLQSVTSQLSSLRRAGSDEKMFERVASGRSMLDALMEPPAKLDEDTAIQRLTGALLGPDGKQSCVVAWLTEASRRELRPTLTAIRGAVTECGVPLAAMKLGGPPVANAAIDEVSAGSLNTLIPFTCAVGLMISWFSMRSLRLTVLILVTALYGMAASLAFLWLSGIRMNAVLITMVPLVYVVSTSGAIHLCNYYRQCIRKGGVHGAAGRSVSHAMLPLGLAASTTIAGLLSICYTDLWPIQLFGIFSAVGVGFCWLLLMTWLPATLTVFPEPAARQTSVAAIHDNDGLIDTGEAPLPDFWQRAGDFVIRRHAWILGGSLVIMAIGLVGMPSAHVSIDVMREFRSDSTLVQDYEWLEQHVGPLVPLEVVLRFDDKACPLNMLARARLVERIQRSIGSLDEVGGVISAVTFCPDLRKRDAVRESVLNGRFLARQQTLEETGYLALGEGEQLWRISARVTALAQIDYSAFAEKLKSVVERELQSQPAESAQGISARYTGLAPLFFKARHALVNGVIWGIGADLLLIVVTISLAMRHWSSGLLLLATSVFPTAVVIGGAGWLGITLDQGAILAPCVALGVSVDDVIHFLIWFRWGIQHGHNQQQAVSLAWRCCARPMYQSWALLGLGMATLGVSAYVPILKFGMMMVAMLSVGLAGNLLLLPPLLAGPLGRVIARSCRTRCGAEAPHALPAPEPGSPTLDIEPVAISTVEASLESNA